jgi:transposase
MQLRKKLIMMTSEQGISVYKACKRLKINYSTGKSIVKQFQDSGKVFKRKLERKAD